MRKYSTEISKDIEIPLKQSDLNNNKNDTLIGKSSDSFNGFDINKFINFLKNGKINEEKSFISTQEYYQQVLNLYDELSHNGICLVNHIQTKFSIKISSKDANIQENTDILMSHWKIGPDGTTFLILLQHCKNHEQLEDI
ncbi:hypothetical protein GLOIN_2v1868181 [Rhizophagus irregularis DAOM 181602=DAOM 197198]|nr:hypothetical protein GLOIN_2v1868181 [Rhizophagus irregularis DAOM 181602=DAOM 197198]